MRQAYWQYWPIKTVEKILKAIKIFGKLDSVSTVIHVAWNWQWLIVRCRHLKKKSLPWLIQSRQYRYQTGKKNIVFIPCY
jgi:hypothetical protein